MPQNGQTHFKNLAAIATRFFKYISPFWAFIHERVKEHPRDLLISKFINKNIVLKCLNMIKYYSNFFFVFF